eukprot:gi/632934462/ref/XP_007884328.1/ PREDICTED: transmembrane 4 L6 family member 19 [Callorhinchus milii]
MSLNNQCRFSLAPAEMCVGCCARCIGIALISLALTAIVTNLMLLFPNGKTKHILEKHIAWEARILPGGWGGGIPVLLAGLYIKAAAHKGHFGLCIQSRMKMLMSILYSFVAGACSFACLCISGLGLANGPLCLFNETLPNGTQVRVWEYPFHTESTLIISTENYLYHHSLWRVCEHPRDIVLWNVVLFSILMGTSAIETILCSLQMMNGLLGCMFGAC